MNQKHMDYISLHMRRGLKIKEGKKGFRQHAFGVLLNPKSFEEYKNMRPTAQLGVSILDSETFYRF